MRPITSTVTMSAAAATGVAASQTPTAAGFLTINGTLATAGVANLANAQQVSITSGGNDSGRLFTITGTVAPGIQQSDVVRGANAGTAVSTLPFLTVTSVYVDGPTAGAVTVGRAATSSS